MKQSLNFARWLAIFAWLSCALCAGQSGSGVISHSGSTTTFGNPLGALTASFEEIISGSPATVSIVIQGCMRGGTCTTADTYTTVANAVRTPVITAIYDYFSVTASWTGGASVSVTVNATLAPKGSGGGPIPDGNAADCWVGTGAWAACGNNYTLPTATSSVLGGVKPDGTKIANSSGVISVGSGVVCVPSSFAAQTDGATVTWAVGSSMCANASLLFTVHSGGRTLNLTGLVAGGSYVLKITQDGTGGEGLTLGSGCTWKVSGGGSGAITPSTGPSAIDVLAFTYDGTNCLANFATNFN
jgi:hypothetical protein